jgi:DNA mismatch repair protein MutS
MASTGDEAVEAMSDSEREFRSVLFADGADVNEDAPEPGHFRDLNLDQVVAAVVAGREEYSLEPFFRTPLESVEAVEYRHEVLHDLERPEVHAVVTAFARDERRVRVWLDLVGTQHQAAEKRRWLVDAALLYCRTVVALRDGLAAAGPAARALRGLHDYLTAYTRSEPFEALAREAETVLDGLAGVRYTLRIKGNRVTVGPYEGEPDYSAEVAATFARFRGGGAGEEQGVADSSSMDHVEARIVRLVARLHPREFAALDEFWKRHRSFVEPTVARFERELQVYLAWLEHVRRLEGAGLGFCYPALELEPPEVAADGAFDLALAEKRRSEGGSVVPNGLALAGGERIVVVSGPNQGGKTTFARTVGQLHELARLGLTVPGRRARLPLVDGIYTHFEREESIATLRGKLEDELLGVREILERASSRSLVILNEIFSSTSLPDGILLGRAVLRQLAELGSLALCVTFVDELASLDERTVSMVASVDAEDPSRRTFEITRRPADGRAYAAAIATKYGLSYDRLRERLR